MPDASNAEAAIVRRPDTGLEEAHTARRRREKIFSIVVVGGGTIASLAAIIFGDMVLGIVMKTMFAAPLLMAWTLFMREAGPRLVNGIPWPMSDATPVVWASQADAKNRAYALLMARKIRKLAKAEKHSDTIQFLSSLYPELKRLLKRFRLTEKSLRKLQRSTQAYGKDGRRKATERTAAEEQQLLETKISLERDVNVRFDAYVELYAIYQGRANRLSDTSVSEDQFLAAIRSAIDGEDQILKDAAADTEQAANRVEEAFKKLEAEAAKSPEFTD